MFKVSGSPPNMISKLSPAFRFHSFAMRSEITQSGSALFFHSPPVSAPSKLSRPRRIT